MSSSEPDSVAVNRELWTRSNAEWTDARALQAWQRERFTWGVWRVDESEVCALPDELAGLDVVELGCGTAYVSGWLARRGARPIGVDPTPAPLDSAGDSAKRVGDAMLTRNALSSMRPLRRIQAVLTLARCGSPAVRSTIRLRA